MYGYRSNQNGLMTNHLNSISSSLSSVDTIGRRTNAKSSANKLLTNGSIANGGGPEAGSSMWSASNNNNKTNDNNAPANMNPRYMAGGPSTSSAANNNNLYQTNGSIRHATAGSVSHHGGSEIYYSHNDYRKRRRNCWSYLCWCCCCCLDSVTALNLLLVPLLLLTITRQVFDFMGQIWLQILINFFTIIIVIVALFGLKQPRISYIVTFTLWALLNTVWNILVACIHTKQRDLGFLNEEFLSFNTGAKSWWYSNHPGCLPYNLTNSMQPSVSIIKPTFINSCKLDYHLIESSQAMLHAVVSFIALLVSGCAVMSIRRNPAAYYKKYNHANVVGSSNLRADKLYRLNNLIDQRANKISSDPYASSSLVSHMTNSRFDGPLPIGAGPAGGAGMATNSSLRRASVRNVKSSSRSSQHSMASVRSARRRAGRLASENEAPLARGSTSSMQASQKYGSLSSRRSNSRKERRSDISSMTYGTASIHRQPTIGENPNGGAAATAGTSRTRASSQSSVEYLPSYQPPHSSNANLLSSYGELSSIDSYNNNNNNNHYGQTNGDAHGPSRTRSGARNRQVSVKSVAGPSGGNTNPTYVGSRSSICSRTNNSSQYDDVSYIYSGQAPNSVYGNHGKSTFDSNNNNTSRSRAKLDGQLKMTQVNTHPQNQQPIGSRHHPIYSNQATTNANSETPI